MKATIDGTWRSIVMNSGILVSSIHEDQAVLWHSCPIPCSAKHILLPITSSYNTQDTLVALNMIALNILAECDLCSSRSIAVCAMSK